MWIEGKMVNVVIFLIMFLTFFIPALLIIIFHVLNLGEKEQKWTKRKTFVILALLIVISPLIIPITYRIVHPGEVERREQNLRTEFQTIVHPEGATLIEVNISGKIVARSLGAEYRYKNMSDSEIEKYYYEEVTRHGWIKQPESEERYKHLHDSFYRKGDYEMTFTPLKDSWVIHLKDYKDFFNEHGL